MNLNDIAIFIKVVETGSLIGAAKALDMPKSTVSTRLAALEKRLGVTLIRRTTRKLHVTDSGHEYYVQCLQGMSQIIAAEEVVTRGQSVPHGLLKITAPIELGGALLPLVIKNFSKKYPDVELEVILTDKTMDLVSEGIDVAIRSGNLSDSSLIGKKLGTAYLAPFASQTYLKQHGEPKHPKELSNHCTILFSLLKSDDWQLTNSKEKVTVKLKKKMVINDLNLIKALTVTGQGISLLPSFLTVPEIKSGKLVRILGHWRTETRPIHFVYPSEKFVSPKIKAFIEVAGDIIKEALEAGDVPY